MILYLKDPKDSTHKFLENMNSYIKVAEYKINFKKAFSFLYTYNEQLRSNIWKQFHSQ
jgi:hypothetical protein